MTVTYYGTNELDCYADSVTQAVNGANWMGLEEPSLFADYVGDAAMVIAPMLYATNEEYNYVMDSEFVANLIEELKESNIHILDTHYSFGFQPRRLHSRGSARPPVPRYLFRSVCKDP